MRTAYIIIITMMLGFFALANSVMADMDSDKRNPGNDKYPMCKDIENLFEKEWCEIVEFQKQGWEDGKTQLAKDKQTITNFFNKVVSYVTQN